MNCPACGSTLVTIKAPLRISRYCFTCGKSMPTKSMYDYNQRNQIGRGMTPDQLLQRIGHSK